MKICSCKGIRTCAVCNPEKLKSYIKACVTLYFCPKIAKIVKETCNTDCDCAECHVVIGDFNGISLIENFLSDSDKTYLLNAINQNHWVESQSGRRKQDFGPKVNFKKKKINITKFQGLPNYIERFVARFKDIQDLEGFHPVELCNLEYDPTKGASIDPHFDDFWLWGKRLVTLNVQSSTYLTFTPGTEEARQVSSDLVSNWFQCQDHEHVSDCSVSIKVPMAEGSLIIVHGDARHCWLHAVHAGDVQSTRIAITLRELSHEYLDTEPELSDKLMEVAVSFCGQPVV